MLFSTFFFNRDLRSWGMKFSFRKLWNFSETCLEKAWLVTIGDSPTVCATIMMYNNLVCEIKTFVTLLQKLEYKLDIRVFYCYFWGTFRRKTEKVKLWFWNCSQTFLKLLKSRTFLKIWKRANFLKFYLNFD